ncbi:hypothetical protein ABTM87_19055, partial [Acinetobacter baumannii]
GFLPLATRGYLDPSLGFKYRLQRPDKNRGEVTFEAQTTVPTSDDPLRANEYDPTLKLLGTIPVGDDQFGYNLVWARIGQNGTTFDQSALALT